MQTENNIDANSADLVHRIRRLEAAEAGRKRRVRAAARATGLAIVAVVLALPGLATALGDVPNAFADGDVISAQEMNANFEHLVAGVTATEERGPGAPCGVTANVTGDVGGYAGGATMCEAVCGTARAHICTTHEMIRHASAGGSVAVEGWIATGVSSNWSNNGQIDDCTGFTGAAGAEIGTTWQPDDTPSIRFCGAANHPLHCCAPS